jgi:hypothetical protein
MPDRRENILARMFVVVSGVSGFATAVRNEIEFDDTSLPAVSVLEGEEVVDLDNDNDGRGQNQPQRITAMIPVYIKTAGADAGTQGNALRVSVVNAVLNDATLKAMARRVRYAGVKSQLHPALLMIGGIAVMFAVTYMQQPSEIVDD